MMPETENGRAIAQIRAMDPAFEPYEFVRWCRDDLIPRVLKAQMAENREALGNACSKKVWRPLFIYLFIYLFIFLSIYDNFEIKI
jgi:hypothetical protein